MPDGKLKTVRLKDPETGKITELRVVRDGIARERTEPVDRGKPSWLRAGLPSGPTYRKLEKLLQRTELHTVCKEAKCPNTAECWGHGTMTVMILGGICTRACGFCSVDTGNPKGWIDSREPARVAEAVRELELKYVVLTSVDRDDLDDGGAGHYAAVIRAIKESSPGVRVEALIPDFRGDTGAVETVLASGVDVFAHNMETVRELTPRVRDPRATYERSLAVLAHARRLVDDNYDGVPTKSSIMLGLGESDEQILETMRDLREAGVEVLTLGQYLRPTKHHLPVERYVTPEQFDRYRDLGHEQGFVEVFSGPLVRSSYRAEKVFRNAGRE